MRRIDFALVGMALAASSGVALAGKSRADAAGSPQVAQVAPALLVAPTLPDTARRPAPRAAESSINITASFILDANGALKGEAETVASGPSAIKLDRVMARLATMPPEQANETLVVRQSLPMLILALRHTPSTANGGTHATAKVSFSIDSIAGRGGKQVIPLAPGPRLVRGPYVALVAHSRTQEKSAIECPRQSYQQSISIQLPAGFPAFTPPADVAIALGGASYRATYRRDADRLLVERLLKIDTGTDRCSAERVKDIAPAIHAAARDFNRRIDLGPAID